MEERMDLIKLLDGDIDVKLEQARQQHDMLQQ
jgi:hypothetical protein